MQCCPRDQEGEGHQGHHSGAGASMVTPGDAQGTQWLNPSPCTIFPHLCLISCCAENRTPDLTTFKILPLSPTPYPSFHFSIC